MYQVRSRGSQIVGYLILDSLEPLEMTAGCHEFIVLSEAQASGFDLLTWAIKFSDQCRMYNVLLVEWDENRHIAYRLGIGRVLKEAWERARPSIKFVTLG